MHLSAFLVARVSQSHGITSTDAAQNPDFSSWNHVHVWYCSSDSHLGDASPGSKSDFGGWHFRGRRIAAAVITDLLTVWGLNNATHVLLTGDSAGGVGVMNLADDIATTLRVEAPALETVKLFVDAGWFLDIPSYSNRSDGMTFEKCAKALPASYRAVFDRSCEEHFGAEDSWRCFFAQDCQAFLETPTLFHEYLYDSANLGYDGAGSPAEAEDFRSRLEASIKAAAAAGGTGSCAGDSSEEDASPDGRHTQNLHEMIDCTLFTKSHVGDVRFVHVLGAWFAGELSNVHVLDGHGGVRGGDECGVYPALAKQLAAVVSVGV
ncbi:hypothetical protein COCSUDRAFT_60148 [Coccomyxa subellipsoidea C-169]|uniref:Pectin acetylesterase n=1 Tax=Coccomyxa subellipsoidea (strain C-169) TaxID=574566 RepID=I0YJB3_COCSC|nr:hypothetical protein COCSUDRAFT_60148 [Coccomyxa subellipsoidea C-169]EIE18482.1 hypothetical protein COCSUDRAFT_60148 [Coccomyxa subellipsoidea C-169]|eukprot:XP_005643026.1 hypothetical protein COCSUDRAFT_60148 [Coccomyxa subellipsoidea C-169]